MSRTGRRVVITGIGPVTPVGTGVGPFWTAVANGLGATTPLTSLPNGFPVATLRSRVVARVDGGPGGADPRADRRRWMAERALALALDDAALEAPLGPRAAVVLGNAVGSPGPVEAAFLDLERGDDHDAAGLMRLMSFHTPAFELARQAGCDGPVLTISTGCTAGLDAIAAAADLVRQHDADLVVAGSAEAPLTSVVFAAFDLIGATSRRNHDPAHASRPFDRERDGFVLAEGASILILEERERARRRGARIYAELAGSASLSNAYHMTNLPADGAALARCITLALEDAAVPSEAVSMVNAHGSSTPQNDLCETNAVKTALGARAGGIPVNSLKAITGHALGASNAIEMAACALALHHGYVFPTMNLDEPGDGCDLDYAANRGRRAALEHVVKLSNGFSGIHSVVVLSREAS